MPLTPSGLAGARGRVSNLKSELSAVCEIAVGESVQERKTRDAVEGCRGAWDPNSRHRLVKTELEEAHPNQIYRVGSDVCATEHNTLGWDSTTQQAVLFVKQQFKTSVRRARSSVCQKTAGELLTARYEGECHFDDASALVQVPLGARHQRSLHISCTAS
jgi:hypothetical protein